MERCYADVIIQKKMRRRTTIRLSIAVTALVLIFLVIAIIGFAILSYLIDQSTQYKPVDKNRLPRDIVPILYDVTLMPDIYTPFADTFYGNVSIEMRVMRDTPFLVLHVQDLNLLNYRLFNTKDNVNIMIHRTFRHLKSDYWVLEIGQPLEPDILLTLFVQYKGEYNQKDKNGLYKTQFHMPQKNQTGFMAATKLEPFGARRVFPCFDEPDFKAQFKVHLVHKSLHTALSNMPIELIEQFWSRYSDGDALIITHFRQTEYPMSTYLFAVVVTEDHKFTFHSTKDKKHRIRIWAPSHLLNETIFAGKVALRAITYFDKLFNFVDPMPKIDMVPVVDHISGAMENWGLFTFKYSQLLVSEYQLTDDEFDFKRFAVCKTVIHEISHSWFGNIVTLAWWNDLWLNEGLATFFTKRAIMNNICQLKSINLDQFLMFFDRTYMVNSFNDPIRITYKQSDSSTATDELFTKSVYQKATSLMEMIFSLMSEETFIAWIQKYIKKYAYSTATTENFLDELNTTFPQAYSFIPWLYYSSYPAIRVHYNDSTNFIIINSSSFQMTSDYEMKQWVLWLRFKTSHNPEKIEIAHVNSSDQSIAKVNVEGFNLSDKSQWILFNVDSLSIYRIYYSEYLLRKIIQVLHQNITIFTTHQRSILIDDTFFSVFAQKYPPDLSRLTSFFDLAEYLVNETEYLPFGLYYKHTSLIATYLYLNSNWSSYYLTYFVKPFLKVLSRNDNGLMEVVKLRYFTDIACRYKLNNCSKFASQFVLKHLNTTYTESKYESSLYHKYYFCYGIQSLNTETVWNSLVDMYNKSAITISKVSPLLCGLTATQSLTRFDRLVSYFTKDNNKTGQTSFRWSRYKLIDALKFCKCGTPGVMVWKWLNEYKCSDPPEETKSKCQTILIDGFKIMKLIIINFCDTPEKFKEVIQYYKNITWMTPIKIKLIDKYISVRKLWFENIGNPILSWVNKKQLNNKLQF